MASSIPVKELEEIKRSFAESVALQMTSHLTDFSSKMLTEMDKKLSEFQNGSGGGMVRGNGRRNNGQFNNQTQQSKPNSGYKGKKPNMRPNVTPEAKSNVDNSGHNSAFVAGNDSKTKRINPYLNKPNKAQQINGAKIERKNVKEYVNFNKTENTAKSIQCECEIVINCIRRFEGSYEEMAAYDKKEALRALKKFDTNVSLKEIRNVRRHPGKHDGDYIRVTVLFGNSETPSRLAQKAEDDNDFTTLQRSLPRDIRERNKATLEKVADLNQNRRKENAFLWTTTTVKGLVILIQEPDPNFVKPQDVSDVSEDQFHDSMGSQETHQQNLADLNKKLAENGAPHVTNVPILDVDSYIDDLTPKYGGINRAMIQAILKGQGMKSKEKPKQRPKKGDT